MKLVHSRQTVFIQLVQNCETTHEKHIERLTPKQIQFTFLKFKFSYAKQVICGERIHFN